MEYYIRYVSQSHIAKKNTDTQTNTHKGYNYAKLGIAVHK